jgi:Zn-dependent peptidase ImmA (M78 family)
MNYGIYKDVRNAAWQCLIDAKISRLPLSVVKTAEHYDIAVVKNGPRGWLEPRQSGAALKTEEGWIICYDENESLERIRFTVCHELGHILLGHPLKEGTVQHTRTIDKDRPKVESEADMFAARVLAPACVIWALNLHTAQEISDLCQISLQAAQYRAERMELLYKRNMFLSHPLERRVYEQFQGFINEKKARQ